MDHLTKTVTSYTVKLNRDQADRLKLGLEEKGFIFKTVPHAHFGASLGHISLCLYKSGKLLIQGKDTVDFIQFFLEPEILKEIRFGYENILDGFQGERIGVDESGKGDYFGPIVIAGVFLDRKSVV